MPTPNESMNAVPSIPTDPARTTCPDDSSSSPHRPIWRHIEHGGLQSLGPAIRPRAGQEHHMSVEDKTRPSRDVTAQLGPTSLDNSDSEVSPLDPKAFSKGSHSNGQPLDTTNPFVPALSLDYPTKRLLPSYTSSFLRSGSKFEGKQTSDRSTYEVHVELKHVDMKASFLCGYLRIKGLTEDHQLLTTYFEGEMIGDKYSFQTRRPEWGSSEEVDFQHWGRFPAFLPLVNKAERPDFQLANFTQRDHIFMRWKEYFLVPDHSVKQIPGASFEGFYYICFNQVSGSVSGIYFHAKSERFQKLNLKHVCDRTFGSVEFR